MFTLRDGTKPRFPLITVGLIGVNLLAFWYEFSLGELRFDRFLDLWGVVPRHLTGFFAGNESHPGVLVTPLTSMYLHIHGPHLAINMLYLWVFGAPVEQRLGRKRFLAFYTLCGLIAATAQVLAWQESLIPAVGASGAVAGLLAAYLVLRPGATIAAIAPVLFFFPAVDVLAVILLGLWLLSQLLSGIASLTASPGNSTAWLAHLAGFGAGLLLVFFFRVRRRGTYYHR